MSNILPSPTFLSLLSALLVLARIFLSTYVRYRRPGDRKTMSLPLPPGPRPWPVVGCFFQLVGNGPTFRWIHRIMDEMNTEIACIRIGNVHVIPVTSPELSREFLKKQDSVFSSRPLCLSAELTSNAYRATIMTPLGDNWKKMRRILACHLLSPASHHWLHDKRDEEADNLVQYVYNQCKNSFATGGLVNVRTAAQHYCANVIRRLIFNKRNFGKGMEDGGPGAEEEEHVAALFTILNYLYAFGVSDYISWLRIFDIGGHEKILRNAIRSVRKYQDPEIDERIEMWNKGRRTKPQDMLDVLITLRDDNGNVLLTSQEIKAQMIDLMLATVDNPSNAIEWTIAEMLNQPEILRTATKELDDVVGRERWVRESDLPLLNYIRACIREAFRLHPLAPFNVPHVSTSDTTVAGYFIPKGSQVILSRPGLGRNPRIWEEPLKFKPERHLKPDGSRVDLVDHELRMLSFSTGRRGCAGVQLGDTITTMLLARLLQGFSWSIPPDMLKIDLTESLCDMQLAKPLVVLAKLRLPENMYPETQA